MSEFGRSGVVDQCPFAATNGTERQDRIVPHHSLIDDPVLQALVPAIHDIN